MTRGGQLVAGCALAGLLATAGCGPAAHRAATPPSTAATTITTVAPAASTTLTTVPQPASTVPLSSSTVPAASIDLRVYFLRGDHLGVGRRRVAPTLAVATAAIRALLAGPTSGEAASGLATAIPPDTRLKGLTIAGGIATVDLSSQFASGGGSLSMVGRLAQVTYTLTQFPTVSSVLFRLDGEPVTVFGGEGIVLDHPASRSSFESVTPAILVESPAPGDAVRSPIRLAGSANVFEAVFRVELTDAGGRVLAERQVLASSGTGTRGTFDIDLAYTGAGGQGQLTVFDVSARDGTRQDVVSIPVRLSPA